MIRAFSIFRRASRRFRKDESGMGAIEFVMGLPVFMFLVTLSFEIGLLSTRQVMLEHGLNQAVRDVRLGLVRDPTHENLILSVCNAAGLIPDCTNQLRLEMFRQDIRALDMSQIAGDYHCRDRDEPDNEPLLAFTNTGDNNDLMFLRVCVLFDPLIAHFGIGERITNEFDGGAYALVASSGYVLEPFR